MDFEKNYDFEQALERLEEIVGLLEEGNLKLNDALDLFNEGITLVKICNNFIAEAKKDIKIFLTDEGIEMPWDEWKE